MARVKRVLGAGKLGQKVAGPLLLIALVVLAVGFSGPKYSSANAQSWMDKVFGNLGVPRRSSYRKRRYVAPKQDIFIIRNSRSSRYQKSGRRSTRGRKAYGIGRIDEVRKNKRKKKRKKYLIPRPVSTSYRTMCVRTCDGFFFPVSFATSKNRLKKDERVCKSSCGAPAKLYYYPNPGGEIEDMVSYRGKKKYKKLKYAFLYKTKFVASCRCKPEPWTQAAKQKHEKYARVELKRRTKIASRKKASKRRMARKRVKSRRKGRRYSRRSSRNKRRALRTVGLKRRAGRKIARRTYRVRKTR